MTYGKFLMASTMLAAALLLSPLWVGAQEVAQDVVIPAPKFNIDRFEVVGDNILGAETVQRLVTPFTGKDKDFGDVQKALEALEKAYTSKGYSAVQVVLPEQQIERGARIADHRQRLSGRGPADRVGVGAGVVVVATAGLIEILDAQLHRGDRRVHAELLRVELVE